MAGSISLSLSQQFDPAGKPYAGGQVFFIQAGTVATPQNAFQDLGLTLPWPNPYTLLADGRLPNVYFADGYIKVRITDKTGVQIFNQDNIPVTGPSSGGGGGGGVDPTTVSSTGDVKWRLESGVISGWVRINGRTIGNASSGATERANADTAALFSYIWSTYADAVAAVVGGRGISAAADFAANKQITLLNGRAREIRGLDDMGNAAAGAFPSVTFRTGNATTPGADGGVASTTLAAAQIPSITSTASPSLSVSTTTTGFVAGNTGDNTPINVGNGGTNSGYTVSIGGSPTVAHQAATGAATGTVSSTSNNTGSQAVPMYAPFLLGTLFWKL